MVHPGSRGWEAAEVGPELRLPHPHDILPWRRLGVAGGRGRGVYANPENSARLHLKECAKLQI